MLGGMLPSDRSDDVATTLGGGGDAPRVSLSVS